MAWKLIIEMLMVAACQVTDPGCPPPRPPVVQEMVMASEADCQRRLAQYRTHIPATRTLVQTSRIHVEHRTTLRCVSQ